MTAKLARFMPDRESASRSERSPIMSRVGNTPLIRLRSLEPHPGVEVHAKLEWQNPGGSIKDRAALGMIEAAERTGALGPGRIIIDATSGNTGVAYSLFGAILGYRVRLVVPASLSAARIRLLRFHGADIVTTDAEEGIDGAIEEDRLLEQFESRMDGQTLGSRGRQSQITVFVENDQATVGFDDPVAYPIAGGRSVAAVYLGHVEEDIGGAIGRLDEAVALAVVPPGYCAACGDPEILPRPRPAR